MNYKQAKWKEPLLIEKSHKGRQGVSIPNIEFTDKISHIVGTNIPNKMLRKSLELPCLSQLDIVRHFTRLSQMNFSVDLGMYPLGSCTMKYNPKLANRIVNNKDLSELHPHQEPKTVQGLLELLYELNMYLEEITGTDKINLNPSAGAHGELAGVLIIRKYHQMNNNKLKTEIIVPDSAHGTNPASAVMAGFKVIRVKSDKEGLVDIKSLKEVVSERTAGMMLTVPNTHGLFEKNVKEIVSIVHNAGGLMYYDGANLNALLGKVRPGDMVFDIVHINLHKTFSTPHGGGGPGAGPIGVKKNLIKFLPIPILSKDKNGIKFEDEYPYTIGRIKSFYGNIAVLIRALTYILMLGKEGIKEISEQSVLSANYLYKKIISENYSPAFENELPKHEFVVSLSKLLEEREIKAMDVAKKILDYGVHSPTTYFPLTVEEGLMIEPTESETIEEIDQYVRVMKDIEEKITTNPEEIKNAPSNTSINRIDDVKANHPKTMQYNWNNIKNKMKND